VTGSVILASPTELKVPSMEAEITRELTTYCQCHQIFIATALKKLDRFKNKKTCFEMV